MKWKKEYIILGGIILVLSAYLVLRSPDSTHYELPAIPEVSPTEISKIAIHKEGTTTVVNKKHDKWHIAPEGYLADTDKVEGMLESMESLRLTALVSESESYSRYDLDEDHKITVQAWEGKTPKLDFDIGKTASSFQHTFVKLSGDDRVYHAKGNLRTTFDQTVEGLRDKTVLSFDQTEIQEIQIVKDKEAVAFRRTPVPVEVSPGQEESKEAAPSAEAERKPVWQTAEGKEADEAQINRLLTTLSDLHCDQYLNGKKKEDLTDPVCTFVLKGMEEYSLSIFAKEDKEQEHYPAISSEKDYPFLLPTWQADNLMKKPDDMLKKPDKS